MQPPNDIKEIREFLERDSSIIECGKRYKKDVNTLLNKINELAARLENCPGISTKEISEEKAQILLTSILELVREYDKGPFVCGG
jgi:hypothetical protein